MIMLYSTSMFAQVLSLVDRGYFARTAREMGVERAAKGFKSWHQFAAMTFAQLNDAGSLREICIGLASASGKLQHLGLDSGAPSRSTLAYANANRPWRFYERIFAHTYAAVADFAKGVHRKFHFRNPLYSLDSSTIQLCLEVFDWAHYKRSKGAVKLHLLLDHRGYLPCWALISDGKTADVTAARMLNMERGAIVVMDRGYNDYSLFGKWTERGVFFVTRMKDNALFTTRCWRDVPSAGNVISDEVIVLTGQKAVKECPGELRRITVHDEKSGSDLVFLTNNMRLAASTTGKIYKDRWNIEQFFKALKQNMRVKSFLGTSENAVRTQLWTAMIAILLMMYLRLRSTWNWSLSNLIAGFRSCMFTYQYIFDWLDHPLDGSYELRERRHDPGALFSGDCFG